MPNDESQQSGLVGVLPAGPHSAAADDIGDEQRNHWHELSALRAYYEARLQLASEQLRQCSMQGVAHVRSYRARLRCEDFALFARVSACASGSASPHLSTATSAESASAPAPNRSIGLLVSIGRRRQANDSSLPSEPVTEFGSSTWILIGAGIASILLVGAFGIIVRRRHAHLQAILAMLFTEVRYPTIGRGPCSPPGSCACSRHTRLSTLQRQWNAQFAGSHM